MEARRPATPVDGRGAAQLDRLLRRPAVRGPVPRRAYRSLRRRHRRRHRVDRPHRVGGRGPGWHPDRPLRHGADDDPRPLLLRGDLPGAHGGHEHDRHRGAAPGAGRGPPLRGAGRQEADVPGGRRGRAHLPRPLHGALLRGHRRPRDRRRSLQRQRHRLLRGAGVLLLRVPDTDRRPPEAARGAREHGGRARPTLPAPRRAARRAPARGDRAGVAIFFVFSQLESMIPLYMSSEWGEEAVRYFAVLFIANAVLALVMQVPIAWLSGKIARPTLILIGCSAFALSFLCFYLAADQGLAMLYLGIFLWTVGEGVLLPLPDIAVHEIAVDDRKGTYFGIAEIRYIGFFAGPFVGGLLLAHGSVYFVVMALAVFACVPLLLTRGSSPADTKGQEVTAGADS
ncbi:MFS transporter [Streptomyces sp. L06]|nr:MFS transporter [Streptomyces sp. L06]